MITLAIVILTVGFSVYAMGRPDIKFKYLFHPFSIKHFGQHYRFLSHAFLHGDYLHLAFNMYALWIFGPLVEEQLLPSLLGHDEPNRKLGMVFYIVLYTGAIYASSISEFIKHRNNSYYTSLGASGAVNALLFSYITCLPLSEIYFIPAWLFGIIYLGMSYYLSKRQTGNPAVDNVGHEAHFWGAIFGALFTLALGLMNQDVYFKLIQLHS